MLSAHLNLRLQIKMGSFLLTQLPTIGIPSCCHCCPYHHSHDLLNRHPENWNGITGFGVFFLFFGMVLFWQSVTSYWNVLFVAGLAFVIGLERTFRFFFQTHKMKATGFFLGGVFVVLISWPLVGVFFKTYGFFLLFRGFSCGGWLY